MQRKYDFTGETNAQGLKRVRALVCIPDVCAAGTWGVGYRAGITTVYRLDDTTAGVACGCFTGTLDDFAAAH